MEEKRQLRATMRKVRAEHVAALPQSTRALILRRPPAPLIDLLPEGATVGLYYAHPAEAPAHGYARWLVENGRQVALPWFADAGAPMQFRVWRDPFGESDIVPGPFGPQPHTDSPLVTPDCLIVPLLAFGPDGERLGQGGGHYDRWLEQHPQVPALGLAWDVQYSESVPTESHDRPLAAVATPTRIYWSRG